MYKGELISLLVTFLWTVTAMASEVASKRLSPLGLNIIRMFLSLVFLSILMWVVCGRPFPQDADAETWMWLLFNSYLLIGSRFGQLFMTLAPAAAAIFGFILLGEQMSVLAVVGMLVTMFGIGLSVLSKGGGHRRLSLKLPLKGILFGIGAGLGQGIGLVFSKVGMTHYETLITTPEALDLMPFSSTFIRAVTGFVGFSLVMFFTRRTRQIASVCRDRRGIAFAFLATLMGPFLGVSLSLMATLYTSTGIAQTIMAMTPILILLPSWYFFRQKITILEIIGALISVMGVMLFFIDR